MMGSLRPKKGTRKNALERLSRLSDRELVGKALHLGDEIAFQALIDRHTKAVFRFILSRMSGDVMEAEDVLQETWIKAGRGLDQFRWRCSLRSWLIQIALNEIKSLARKRSSRPTLVFEGFDGMVEPADVLTRLDLERATGKLPPRARQVFRLHALLGRKHREIALMLGISEGTSKSQLFRARTLLSEAMGT
jgi:RNA polymerase sigma-70 factor (ECF subfamily)